MKIKYMHFIVCMVIIAVGCSKDQTMIFTPNDIEKIELKLVDKQEQDDGISYSISLVNNSDYVIKQNSIFVYYQIKTENGSKGSGYETSN